MNLPARCTMSRAVMTAILIKPSPAVARMILSMKNTSYRIAVINSLPISP